MATATSRRPHQSHQTVFKCVDGPRSVEGIHTTRPRAEVVQSGRPSASLAVPGPDRRLRGSLERANRRICGLLFTGRRRRWRCLTGSRSTRSGVWCLAGRVCLGAQRRPWRLLVPPEYTPRLVAVTFKLELAAQRALQREDRAACDKERCAERHFSLPRRGHLTTEPAS